MAEIQNYQNHVRWFPLYHFVLTPMVLAFLIYTIVQMVRFPDVDRAMMIFLAAVLIVLTLASRLSTLKIQDRVIRLEESLRYRRVLTPELAERAAYLRTGQIIGLRFAGDEELPELIERALNGEFENTKDIKLAVKNWRGDYLRA
jgi:uncharacterized membrane protein